MNYEQLVNDVIYRVDNPNIREQAKVWINQAYRNVWDAADWTFCNDETILSTVANSKYIATNLDEILGIKQSETPQRLTYISRIEWNKVLPNPIETGTPLIWTVGPYDATNSTSRIEIFPVPNAVIDLIVYYKKPLTELVDADDEPEIPTQYQELLVLGAIYRAYMYNDDQRMQKAYMEFKTKLKDMVRQELTQPDDEPTLKLPLGVVTQTDYQRIF